MGISIYQYLRQASVYKKNAPTGIFEYKAVAYISIEPGPQAWEAQIIPLDYQRFLRMKLYFATMVDGKKKHIQRKYKYRLSTVGSCFNQFLGFCVAQHRLFHARNPRKSHKYEWFKFSSFFMVRLESVASTPLSDSLIKNGPVGNLVGKATIQLNHIRTRGLCVANAAIYQLIYRPVFNVRVPKQQVHSVLETSCLDICSQCLRVAMQSRATCCW